MNFEIRGTVKEPLEVVKIRVLHLGKWWTDVLIDVVGRRQGLAGEDSRVPGVHQASLGVTGMLGGHVSYPPLL